MSMSCVDCAALPFQEWRRILWSWWRARSCIMQVLSRPCFNWTVACFLLAISSSYLSETGYQACQKRWSGPFAIEIPAGCSPLNADEPMGQPSLAKNWRCYLECTVLQTSKLRSARNYHLKRFAEEPLPILRHLLHVSGRQNEPLNCCNATTSYSFDSWKLSCCWSSQWRGLSYFARVTSSR